MVTTAFLINFHQNHYRSDGHYFEITNFSLYTITKSSSLRLHH